MSVKVVIGNLFDSDAQYICHQCNCLTKKGKYIAKDIFDKFKYANVYETREECHWKDARDRPGTITVCGNGKDERYVINMFGQYFPGIPRFPNSTVDGYEKRKEYFKQCLQAIADEDIDSIAFPWKIGCGAAGGGWDEYLKMIGVLADSIDGEVFICRLEDV